MKTFLPFLALLIMYFPLQAGQAGVRSRLLESMPASVATMPTPIAQAVSEELPKKDTGSQQGSEEAIQQLLEQKLQQQKNTKQQFIILNYKDVPIVNIINELAAKLNLNILLPQGAQAIGTKVTIANDQQLTLQEGWQKINDFLELMGYSWIPHNEYLALKKVDINTTRREGLPLYIDVPVNTLPDSPDVIQTIFYLSNIKINDPENPVTALLNDPQTGMLSRDAFVQVDEKTNALIIVDRANTIKAAMTIIKELDLEGIPDAIEVMPLYYTDAYFVQALFKELIIAPDQQQMQLPVVRGSQQKAAYFPSNTRIMALARTNSIVIMGSAKSIYVIRDFIIKYIDHPLESGRSILHVYDLQYLDAQSFAGVLSGLISPSATGQSESQATGTGPKRDFQDVIIVAELTTATTPIAPTPGTSSQSPQIQGPAQGVQQGGNRLVIAARDHDWQRIKTLIQELDVPQAQVVLEVLVVDLILERTRELGTQLRNPSGLSNELIPNLNFQSGQIGAPQIGGIVLRDALPVSDPVSQQSFNFLPANALMANLLRFFPDGSNANIANISTPGSVIISLQDPDQSGTWLILKALSQYNNASILTQPFLITTNNKQATITSAETRLLEAGANSEGGAIKSNKTWVPAPTTIDILPRISKIANTVNLQVAVSVEEYPSSQTNTRITRQVQTNANVANGEILAIGGLVRGRDDIQISKVPLLGDIPLLGWAFKRKIKVRNEANLMVFITPRIVIPKRGSLANKFTSEKLCIAQEDMDDEYETLTPLRDPITRWFFKPDTNFGQRVISTFTEGKLAEHHDITNETVIAQNNTVVLQPNQVIAQPKMVVQPVHQKIASATPAGSPHKQIVAHSNKASQLKALVQQEELSPLTAKVHA